MGRYGSKPLSAEQKKLIVKLCTTPKRDGQWRTQADVAFDLGISLSTVEKTMKKWRDFGNVEPRKSTGRRRTLTVFDVDFIVAKVEQIPDIYLSELQEALNIVCSVDACLWTIWAALRRRGFVRKRVSRIPKQRDEDRRAAWQMFMALNYSPEQLVFVDEAACNNNTSTRGWAWARVGERARRHAYYIRGVRYSVVPALSLSGILHLMVLNRSVKANDFNSFIDMLLDNMNPFPAPNSVIVMDNASIHKSEDLRPMIEARGMRLEYLPPYSPDYDPIEEGFSSMKAWIQRNRALVEGQFALNDPYGVLWQAAYESMTADKAEGWFYHSGYL